MKYNNMRKVFKSTEGRLNIWFIFAINGPYAVLSISSLARLADMKKVPYIKDRKDISSGYNRYTLTM